MELKINKGLDLNIEGAVDAASDAINVSPSSVAISPDDFESFIPKTAVRVGDTVAVGDPVLYDKTFPDVKLTSPVSGTVTAIERGARRHIDRVIIVPDNADIRYRRFDTDDISTHEGALRLLATSGLLALIRRRPFADIPHPDVRPRDIFVTAFDSSPLAVDRAWTAADTDALQAGADLLATISTGNVYISHRADSTMPALANARNVTVYGPHPAGLPGIQAANIAPVNKGETIWTLSADTMWRIGRLALTGQYDPTAFVAVCGSCVSTPYIAKTVFCADVRSLLNGHLADTGGRHIRVISGNVLTGVKVDPDNGYLHSPYTQLTVIPEGDDVDEFMGWASLSPSKMSVSPTFPGRFLRRLFNPDARIHGGRRAMIMSGEYDRVLPMDIMAEYLIKAINGRDIDAMEKLGIYEVAPEDFALAECIDSSKQPLQKIVRDGLDYLRKELR